MRESKGKYIQSVEYILGARIPSHKLEIGGQSHIAACPSVGPGGGPGGGLDKGLGQEVKEHLYPVALI